MQCKEGMIMPSQKLQQLYYLQNISILASF